MGIAVPHLLQKLPVDWFPQIGQNIIITPSIITYLLIASRDLISITLNHR